MKPSISLDNFHVIAVVSNPMRYRSRYNLMEIFSEDILRKGAKLWVAELQAGARLHQVTDWGNQPDFQLWQTGLDGVIWNKENLQNYLTYQLTQHATGWRYVWYTDADVKYEAGHIEKVAHSLQLHPVVQPWSHSVDFAPDGGAVSTAMQLSYAFCHYHGIKTQSQTKYTQGGHPGYSMAMRREAYNQLGGLIDIGILGSGDRHMMTALVNKVHESYHHKVSAGYKKYLHQWQSLANRYIKRNLGYTPGVIRHMFHGSKKNRFYGERWQILVKWQFDPYTDLKRDANGLWQLVVEDDRQIGLRDDLYKYFGSRNEDANTL